MLKKAITLNSLSALCITKLDVFDGFSEIKLCVDYKNSSNIGQELTGCEPVLEVMPGWSGTTAGAKSFDDLPIEAQNFLKRVEELAGIPIDIVSTGPDRVDTIVLKHPF